MVDLLEQYSIEDLAEIIEERNAGYIVLFPIESELVVRVLKDFMKSPASIKIIDDDEGTILDGVIERGVR